MPLYNMKNVATGEVEEKMLSISTMEQMLESGEWVQVHRGKAPGLISQNGDNLSKAPDGYKDLLKQIKKGSGRGNTIKV